MVRSGADRSDQGLGVPCIVVVVVAAAAETRAGDHASCALVT